MKAADETSETIFKQTGAQRIFTLALSCPHYFGTALTWRTIPMKIRLFALSAAATVLVCANCPAFAGVAVGVSVGVPAAVVPAYVPPPPAVVVAAPAYAPAPPAVVVAAPVAVAPVVAPARIAVVAAPARVAVVAGRPRASVVAVHSGYHHGGN